MLLLLTKRQVGDGTPCSKSPNKRRHQFRRLIWKKHEASSRFVLGRAPQQWKARNGGAKPPHTVACEFYMNFSSFSVHSQTLSLIMIRQFCILTAICNECTLNNWKNDNCHLRFFRAFVNDRPKNYSHFVASIWRI